MLSRNFATFQRGSAHLYASTTYLELRRWDKLAYLATIAQKARTKLRSKSPRRPANPPREQCSRDSESSERAVRTRRGTHGSNQNNLRMDEWAEQYRKSLRSTDSRNVKARRRVDAWTVEVCGQQLHDDKVD